MFGSSDDNGLGFQLAFSRTVDTVYGMFERSREDDLLDYIDRLRSGYNRLLGQAQSVERALQERNQQLVAAQNELALRTQQLEASQNELKAVYARNAFEASERRLTMIALQNLRRADDRERLAGSKPK